MIGRTDDPQNPRRVAAIKADSPFGSGSRNPSGPAAVCRVKQAGHTHATEPDQISFTQTLAPKGPSTHKLAAVALANKIARVAWAMMTRGEDYRQTKAA